MQLADDACPSCGGAGGGPFGRPGSAWDDERYVCARCRGAGAIAPASQRPGIAKASSPPAVAKKRAAGDDEG